MLGAGGAGLSGAARLLAEAGHEVSGHDREASPFTESLGALGVSVALGASQADQQYCNKHWTGMRPLTYR